MRIGVTVGLGEHSETDICGLLKRVKELEARGFPTVWMPTGPGFDPVTALAVAGAQTSTIELGSAVVPTWPRHPVALAQQALTAQAAAGGRFTLGVGISHQVMMTGALGLPYDRPLRHIREYLEVINPLVGGSPVSFRGEVYNVSVELSVSNAVGAVPVVLAAMGPAMLRLAGTATAGTITSWVGPRTLADHIVPTIESAAAAAGRVAPRVVVGLPIALTHDPEQVRDRLADQAAVYATLPSYRAMLAREGAAGPADVALCGDEAALDAGLDRLRNAGATDFAAQLLPLGIESVAARTIEYLASRL